MKSKLMIAAVSLAVSPLCWALPHLKVDNGQLVDDSGRVVILHGLNEMNKQAPYEPSAIGFNEKSVQFIEDHGFNVIRLGVFWAAIEPTPGHYNDAYLANIKKTIQLLAKHNIYTLIDFHQDAYSTKDGYGAGEPEWAAIGVGSKTNPGFPLSYYGGVKVGNYVTGTRLDDDFTKFWKDTYDPASNEGLQESYFAMVKHTVSYFGDMPSIVGYEPMNEPFVGDDWRDCNKSPSNPEGGCRTFESTQLKEFSTRFSYAIHSINPNTITWFEPHVSFGMGDPTYIGRINDENTGFSFHEYDIAKPSVPINHAIDEQQLANVPLFMTEFGAALCSHDQLSTIADLADQHQISWVEWAYTNNPNFKFAHVPGKPPADQRLQGLVINAKKPLTGKNVNWDRLSALTRIYPEFIAGTDIKFNYNSKTKVFTLSYTAKPGITEISVPTLKGTTYTAYAVGAKRLVTHTAPVASGTMSFENQLHDKGANQVVIVVKTQTS